MSVNLIVAVTDDDWFEMLRRPLDLAEVNFWAPSTSNFKALEPGADAREFGRGLECAQTLERANIIVNKNLIPSDAPEDWDYPGGLRMGTTEMTRYGMKEREMDEIADLIARVIVRRESPESVKNDALALRSGFRTLYYCFETGLPA